MRYVIKYLVLGVSDVTEEYLEDQYHRDLQDLGTIEEVLRETAKLFEVAFDPKEACWPYELRAGATTVVPKNSQGTSAMILAALGKMVRRCTHRDNHTPQSLSGISETLTKCFELGISHLAQTLGDSGKILSNTFGPFDPLTISHVAELKRGLVATSGSDNKIESALKRIPRAAEKINELVDQTAITEASFLEARHKDPHWCSGNAFVILRIARAFTDLTNKTPSNYKAFFETRLHEQLSFSSIPDSRFDPAELAFCLEGLLVCAASQLIRCSSIGCFPFSRASKRQALIGDPTGPSFLTQPANYAPAKC